MRPKDALKQAGFPVSMGKGRLSKAAIEKCKELAASGVMIDGYEVTRKVNSETRLGEGPVVTKTATVTNEKVIEAFTILYPHEVYVAKGRDGRVWSMKECCNTCRVSLVQNMCEHPTILGNIPVDIVPRT